ncbi:MAG: aminoacyl-tRNA hydrolase [Oscillospiraceae bacterium]|nr:aminoacyl-tRNA hydrolase [Oscillospiraceae bacterium]MBQ9858839.1 aminoacyl-tRNA hydrolase [Oscillospiraceae bacterium]
MFFKKKTGVSWLLVFLGNPGAKYEKTRHNVGFMTGDALSKKLNVKIDRIKYKALIRQADLDGEPVLLMKPQTYMNLSGSAVKEAMDFYKIPLDHVVVVSDDVTLPVGKLRVRRSGSAGGHNGLKDIIAKCGGDGFPRVKIGVGEKPHPDYDMADWVLSSFKGDDAKAIDEATEKAADAVKTIVLKGVDKAMNLYN